MSVQQEKADLRDRLRSRRAARTAAERADAAERIADRAMSLVASMPGATPALLTAYLSLPSEPGTDPLIAAAHAAGHAVWVPRIRGDDLDWLAFRPGDDVRSGPMGIREPLGTPIDPLELAGVDALLVPGLAASREGHRLGKGGGFYDRALARLAPHADGGPLRVVVVFEDEVLEALPHEPHDARVDAALTPQGVVRF